jgi:N6-L-threonylcarbamoyladenine synthase
MDRAGQGGEVNAYTFPKTHMTDTLDFSFSGLKTSALNLINQTRQKGEDVDIRGFAASYQKNIADVLLKNTMKAAEDTGINKICLAGGVSANSFLRKAFDEEAGKRGIKLFYPSLKLCTDNGAMIASAGYFEYINNARSDLSLNACPSLSF